MNMKAVVCTKYGPPEVLQVREVEKPVPKNHEILIKIFATAVTSSDCIIRGFKLPAWSPMGLLMGLALGFAKPRQPILGMVFAGEVESVGKEAKSFSKGDQVFGWDRFAFGTYAEYKCMPEDGMLAMKPDNANAEEVAAVPYGGLLALHYLGKGKIQKGHKVLIYGASGAVGTFAVQLARIEDLILLKKLVESGKLKPVIDRIYPLEEMAEAHTYVDKGHKKGNVVISVGHDKKTIS
jgi:NADPH:quinone reductase-like Zn-dependent oxidoreductase